METQVTQVTTSPPSWIAFVPLGIVLITVQVTLFFLARRKGRSFVPYFILGLIPLANFIALIWLASQTDASVKAELAELKRRLDAKP